MRVRCFSTGQVRPKRGARGVRRYAPGGWDDRTLPVNVFVVEHPAGVVLFDTGQEAAAARPGYFPAWYPFFRLARFELGPQDEAGAQVRRPGDVAWVVLSHLHTDHAGGLAPFAGARVLVSDVEWARATGVRGRLNGYLPGRWPRGLEPVVLTLRGGGFGPFAAAHDLLGDGLLRVVCLPGHTPGHIGLLVAGDPGTAVLLGGDAAHTARELEDVAPPVARFCRDEQVLFLGSHDPQAAALLAAHRPDPGPRPA